MNGTTAAAIAEGVLTFALLAWKSLELTQVGHRIPLRFVVAFLACACAARPVGVLYGLRVIPAADRWLTAAESALMLGCLFSLNCFFLVSLLPGREARRRITSRVSALAFLAAALTTAAAQPGLPGHPAAVIHLLYTAGAAGFLADSWRWGRRGIPRATSRVARGLTIASTGIAVIAAGRVLLTACLAAVITAAGPLSALARAGQEAVQAGVLVFLIGIAYPGAAMRAVALRAWPKDLRTFRALGPLWALLHRACPEACFSQGRSPHWAGALTPGQASRRSYRRVMEVRDGLVRISPHLDLRGTAGDDNTVLAERLVAAVIRTRPRPPSPEPVPIAIPPSPGITADAAELARLSREVGKVLSREQHRGSGPGAGHRASTAASRQFRT